MTVRVYRSTDASAPTLTNVAGSIIGVLDACLVTGYGAKTAAGWTKEYSGTNKAAYRQGALATYSQYYLWVNNSTTQYAFVRAYESMTDIDTGTNPFPHSTQVSSGCCWFGSGSGTTEWIVVATERNVYFWAAYSAIPTGQAYWQTFGDFTSVYGSTDKNNCILIGSTTTSISSAQHTTLYLFDTAVSNVGRYAARSRDGIYPSVPMGLTADCRYHNTSSSSSMLSYVPTPNLTDSKFVVQPVYLTEAVSAAQPGIRGKLNGILSIANGQQTSSDTYLQSNRQNIKHGDIITIPSLPGKTFEAIATRSYAVSTSWTSWLIETSDTW